MKTNQKKTLLVLVGVIVALFAIKAYACYTQTIIVDGRIVNCTTCGDVTTCY